MSELSRRGFVLGAAITGACCAVPHVAAAEEEDRRVAKRYRFPTPDSDIETGGAIITVFGSLDAVHKVVTSYGRYVDILPRLSLSRVVGQHGRGVDVYLRAPILKGLVSVWGVSRFTSYRWRRRGKKVVGRYLKGNLDAFRAVWKLHPCGTRRTVLRLELFVDPKVPVPADRITHDLEWAADKSVTAVRDMVECDKSSVKDD